MTDYIEREVAIKASKMVFCELLSGGDDELLHTDADDVPVVFVRDIEAIPAADVRPVVRGEWVGYPECLKYPNAYSDDHIVCSACEECFNILDNDCERFNFCPNCGSLNKEDET